ncbi:MAG: hypothetical protein ACI9GH_000006 [Candidatus Paceibacteria bacterium]|jgi:hypothetical protein
MPKKPTWDLKKIKKGLTSFYKVNKRYPTSVEFDKHEDLPSSRQIQRRFGGLVNLRKELKLTGQHNLAEGSYSSKRASDIYLRKQNYVKKIYKLLEANFEPRSIHRNFSFTDDHRAKSDFFISYKKKHFSVDVFYANDKGSLLGCLNSKLRKYDLKMMNEFPVIFLQINEDTSQDEMNILLKNKKKGLTKNQFLMDVSSFKEFCKKMKAKE